MQRPLQNQNLRQTQNVMLSPQMQLAMRVLESAHLDLVALIQAELDQNPLLETEPVDEGGSPGLDDSAAPLDGNTEDRQSAEEVDAQSPASLDEFDIDYMREENEWTALRDQGEDLNRERPIAERPTPTEQLVQEIHDQSLPPHLRDVAILLVYWLDEAGFLRESDAVLAQELQLSESLVAEGRICLQSLEPAGLAACDLVECFKLQLARRGELSAEMTRLLDHLDLLTTGPIEKVARTLNLSLAEVKALLARLKNLAPRPLDALTQSREESLAPDIRLFERGGEWVAEINEDYLPAIHLREDYWQELARLDQKSQLQRYLKQHRQSGRWLQRTIHTRAMSLLRVTNAIIARQTDYLAQGTAALKPMTIRQIADDVGLNEGTVSRVVANKLIETPFGIIPLRRLFTSAVGGDAQSDAYASGAVKFRIKALIDAEPPQKPLSDARLVQILEHEGIKVARRTVTKYREALGLASSVDRRRVKNLAL